jgi:selenocysteine lyase/cysteine desulfurase
MAPAASPVVAALRTAIDEWEAGSFSWRDSESAASATRGLFAEILGVDETSVALMSSVSEAATTVARSLPVGTIVLGEKEFRSNLLPWLQLRDEGFTIRQVTGVADIVQTRDLIDAIDPDTTLVAVSEVLSRNGNRADVPAIAAQCRSVGARLFVDATQSLGALRLPPQELDFVACHGYKWLLAPRGCAWLYARPDRLAELRPCAPSWRSSADGQYFGEPTELPSTARKLDSSFSWLPWLGARAALTVIASVDPLTMESHVLSLAQSFRSALTDLGVMPLGVETPSHIVVVPVVDAPTVERQLHESNIAATSLGEAVRFGFHGFNNESDVDLALRALTQKRRIGAGVRQEGRPT